MSGARPLSAARHFNTSPPGVLRFIGAILFGLCGCAFDPVARPVQQERLMDGPVRVFRTLDAYGSRALIRYEDDDGELVYAISSWRADDRCVLPSDTRLVWDPLVRGIDTRKQEDLLVPIGRGSPDDYQLWLVDQDCKFTGPLAQIDETKRLTFSSADDQRDIFLFRDPDNTLYVLDTLHPDEVRKIAEDVSVVRVGTTGLTDLTDAVWLQEGPLLTQRTLDGTLLVSLGESVSTFALSNGILPRVAYVDGEDLFEAVAPNFQPVLRARDACNPGYNGNNLELHVPCEDAQLVRVDLSSGAIEEFEPNVFSSLTINDFQFDYSYLRGDDGKFVEDANNVRQYAQYVTPPGRGAKRVLISPRLRSGSLVVLNDERIAGQTDDGTFGIWSVTSETFLPLFERVAVLVPLRDTRTNEFIWLMQHDVENRAVGTLSVFTQTDLTLKTVATGVPTYDLGGFTIDGGRAIPKFPYPEAILVFLEDAEPLQANGKRYKGRLRAQLLSGELGADLAENVTSYAIVASPLPGVLFGVEEGPNAGLWFAAL